MRGGGGLYDLFWNSAKISNPLLNILEVFHFEIRDSLNGKHPEFSDVEYDKNWILLGELQAKYHDNGIGAPELKYIHKDGREAVFDGDTHQIITDPRYKATYNYVNTDLIPTKLSDIPSFIINGYGHFLFDMLPYYITGGKNERNR